MLWDLAGEFIRVEIDDVEVCAEVQSRRNLAGETISGEIEDGEVGEVFEVGRDFAGKGVGREVECLEVGALGEQRRESAGETQVGERKTVDAAIVAGDTLEIQPDVAGVG